MRKRIGNAFRKAGEAVSNVDESIQSFMREKAYGLPKDGKEFFDQDEHTMRQTFGAMMHGSQPGSKSGYAYSDPVNEGDGLTGKQSMMLSRGVQAGALTVAGLTLGKLTEQVMQFGGPADQQESSQLPLN